MYHPGKVLKIFSHQDKGVRSSDRTTQALVEMWDENLFTIMVDPQLSVDIKEGDIVIVDYPAPTASTPQPKWLISKILKDEKADFTWKRYKTYFEKKVKQQANTKNVENIEKIISDYTG